MQAANNKGADQTARMRTTKVLIRLRGCAGSSAPLLFAYGIRHIFSWPGSIVYCHIYV